jgi:protein transport protein SEC61 subunit alpha
MVRFIDVFGSMARVIPTVKSPDRKVPFREKLGWTVIVLVIFLLMSNIPLYGIEPGTSTTDYLYWMRVILASTHGTLMELGIGPIVTAGLIMQLLAGSKIIRTDLSNTEDRSKFTASQKSLAMLMTVVQALAYILSGAYGTLSLINSIMIFLQLLIAGLVVILLDELTQKGWGLGSGISLFIVANVTQQIMWRSFSPVTNTSDPYWIGAVFATFQGLATGGLQGLGQVFWSRPGEGGSTLGIFATIIVFIIVIYFETYRVNIPLQYAKYRGFRGSYPIKLLYVSNIPVILVQSLFATILFWVQIVAKNNTGSPDNPWLNLLAIFKQNIDPKSGNITYQPIGGLVYFITPPQGILNVLQNPLQAIVYLGLLVLLCAGFAKIWVELSGIAPRDIADQLHGAGMQIPGFRRSPAIMEQVLNRYIPVVALLGGMIVGLLAGLADFFGALGTGMGVLLTVGIIYQLYQTIAQEQLADMHPAIRGMLGVG